MCTYKILSLMNLKPINYPVHEQFIIRLSSCLFRGIMLEQKQAKMRSTKKKLFQFPFSVISHE